MKLNKGLRIASIIFECSLIGSVILYVYNYYTLNKKYEVIPELAQKNLNMFIIIAIVSLILFLVIKYVLYIRNKTNAPKISQLEMEFNELNRKSNANLEEKVVERVMFYKDTYNVPQSRQMKCPNCNGIIDRNAYICLKCGYLVKQIQTERIIEKSVYKPNNNTYSFNNITFDKKQLQNMLINIGLAVAIVVCLILIINIALERGIIG